MRQRHAVLLAITIAALAACGDDGGPETKSEPQGQYALISVGTANLPIRVNYLDGSYDLLVAGSLRVLSRSRLLVASDNPRFNSDGSVRTINTDTVIFSYRRDGDIVELEFFDPLGVRLDTLSVTTHFESPALRALSAHYVRSGTPAPLIRNGLYVKQP